MINMNKKKWKVFFFCVLQIMYKKTEFKKEKVGFLSPCAFCNTTDRFFMRPIITLKNLNMENQHRHIVLLSITSLISKY